MLKKFKTLCRLAITEETRIKNITVNYPWKHSLNKEKQYSIMYEYLHSPVNPAPSFMYNTNIMTFPLIYINDPVFFHVTFLNVQRVKIPWNVLM